MSQSDIMSVSFQVVLCVDLSIVLSQDSLYELKLRQFKTPS